MFLVISKNIIRVLRRSVGVVGGLGRGVGGLLGGGARALRGLRRKRRRGAKDETRSGGGGDGEGSNGDVVAVGLIREENSQKLSNDVEPTAAAAAATAPVAVLPKVVSDSAKSIAALRAIETERYGEDALFKDEFAAALAGEETMAGFIEGGEKRKKKDLTLASPKKYSNQKKKPRSKPGETSHT